MPGWSKSFLNPSLLSALESGRTVEQWLGGRIPGVDYARISTDPSTRSAVLRKGRDAGTGVRHQHEENLETAHAHGVAIVKFFEDNGLTAADPAVRRPAFLDMANSLHCRSTPDGYPVRALIATEHERVWRRADDHAVVHRSVTVTRDGIFIERGRLYEMDSAPAETVSTESEVARTRERVGRHIRRRAIDGGTPGGRRRFGWLPPDPLQGRRINMLRDPDEWPVLLGMIQAALRGTAWNQIARDLNSRGIRTASGNRWSGATVRQALVNPVMCGYRTLNGDLVREPATGLPVTGQWEAPASVEEWQALAALSQQRGAKRGTRLTNGSPAPGRAPRTSRKYLFSGLLRCGATREDGSPCHAKMGGCSRPTAKNPGNAVYVCPSMDCGGTARSVLDVDSFLLETALPRIERHRRASDHRVEAWPGAPLLDLLRAERAACEARQANADPDDPSGGRVADLETRISGLEAARRSHRDAVAEAEAKALWSRSGWPRMTLAEKQAALAEVLHSVLVFPLPVGRSRRAPFDPDLLKIVWA